MCRKLVTCILVLGKHILYNREHRPLIRHHDNNLNCLWQDAGDLSGFSGARETKLLTLNRASVKQVTTVVRVSVDTVTLKLPTLTVISDEWEVFHRERDLVYRVELNRVLLICCTIPTWLCYLFLLNLMSRDQCWFDHVTWCPTLSPLSAGQWS